MKLTKPLPSSSLWFSNWTLNTEGKERGKKEAGPCRLAGLISKGAYVRGFSRVATKGVCLHTHSPESLKVFIEALTCIQSYTQSRWSQWHIALSRLCPTVAPIVGTRDRMNRPRSGEVVRSLHCPGPARASTSCQILLIISFNILFSYWGEKSEDSFSQAVPFFHVHRTKQINHVPSLRWES